MRVVLLWLATMHAYPYLGPLDAARLTIAAVAVETPEIRAELLIAISRVETRHAGDSVSRMTPDGRRTGRWRSDRAGRAWSKLCCGLGQTMAPTWRACRAMRDPRVGLAAVVRELTRWKRYARGDVRRMLAGHGCGFPIRARCGSRGGLKRPYAARVLRELARLGGEP